MPTLTKNQKFQLGEMNATFKTVARWINEIDRSVNPPVAKNELRTTVTIVNKDNGRELAESTSVDEQNAIDTAIEAARVASGAAPAFVDEETRLKAKVDEQAKQLAELSGMVKQMLTAQTPPAKTDPKK
jgi:hypothetical protein